MLKVEAVTFTPNADGGHIQAQLRAGNQEISTAWPSWEDYQIAALIENLTITVEHITFVETEAGREIQGSLSLGGRSLMVSWEIDEADKELQSTFDRLLSEVSTTFMQRLQTLMLKDPKDSKESAA
ncbi:MAG TPA: hypothetical protein VFB58_03055 [Chloroflexota bacterium]|nr:hypothetical protein [Chloroflexota bacterium]